MKLGYIINGENPLLQTILPSDISSIEGNKPLLIVGAEKACELFPNFSFESKTIDEAKRIYYCFSELEAKDKYEEALNNFISHCFSFHIKDFRIINIYNIEELKTDAKRVFIYETNVFITITTDNEIFYINKEIYNFIHKENFTSELVRSSNRIELISWDKYNYFGSYLKPTNQYINIRDFKKLFFKDLSEVYLGALCLKWLNELDNINSNERSLWQRAYYIENYLSDVKIKINTEKLKSYAANETNTLMQTIYSNSCEGYISQGYNGTDKITGRMYVLDSGFSLQTLPPKFKDFIIAEKDCILVEIDYNYFEYDLLSQICDFKVNEDPHIHLSKVIFGDEEHRAIGKTINYGFIYGMAFKNIIKSIYEKFPDIVLDEEDIREKLKDVLDSIDELKTKLEEEFKENGVIFNYYKRRITPEKGWACVNNYIQSTAADFIILKIDKLIQLFEEYSPDNKIILQKHDSILFNLNSKDIDNTDMLEKITEILNEEEDDLKAEFKLNYGWNWKDLE
jgi:hypothetical protein